MTKTLERRHKEQKALEKTKRNFKRSKFRNYDGPLIERYPPQKWRWLKDDLDKIENDAYHWGQFHKHCRCDYCTNQKKLKLKDRFAEQEIKDWLDGYDLVPFVEEYDDRFWTVYYY